MHLLTFWCNGWKFRNSLPMSKSLRCGSAYHPNAGPVLGGLKSARKRCRGQRDSTVHAVSRISLPKEFPRQVYHPEGAGFPFSKRCWCPWVSTRNLVLCLEKDSFEAFRPAQKILLTRAAHQVPRSGISSCQRVSKKALDNQLRSKQQLARNMQTHSSNGQVRSWFTSNTLPPIRLCV